MVNAVAQVSITIHGRQYQIACDDGQAAHLTRLGRYLDERASDLIAATGAISEPLLLVMTSLLVADELADTVAELESLSAQAKNGVENADFVAALDAVRARVEEVAARLEGS